MSQARWLVEQPASDRPAAFAATWAVWHATAEVRHRLLDCLWNLRVVLRPVLGEEEVKRAQAGVIRDLFGPRPFRSVAVDPRWRTRDVLAIAQSIHAHRAFEDMPALGDALEEAGCDCGELLNHCRGGGPHYLGCWALDLVTGRT